MPFFIQSTALFTIKRSNSKVADCILFPLSPSTCTLQSGEPLSIWGILFTEERGDPISRCSCKMEHKSHITMQSSCVVRTLSLSEKDSHFHKSRRFCPLTGWTHLVSLVSSQPLSLHFLSRSPPVPVLYPNSHPLSKDCPTSPFVMLFLPHLVVALPHQALGSPYPAGPALRPVPPHPCTHFVRLLNQKFLGAALSAPSKEQVIERILCKNHIAKESLVEKCDKSHKALAQLLVAASHGRSSSHI